MAKGSKVSKAVVVKKKKWVPILAPKIFNEQRIGESYVAAAEDLVGRKVTVSLMTLTGEPQKQTISIAFKINKITNGTATTDIVGYKMLPVAAKKLVRRRRNKIDDSFIVETSDKKAIRIKPLVATRGKTTGSVLTSMRKLCRAFLAKTISSMKFEDIIRNVVQKKIQHSLIQQLRRLHPIGACEIRQLELIPAERIKNAGLKITLPPENLPDFATKVVKKPAQA